MGQFGRLTRLPDLPSRGILAGYVRKAMALNEQGIKVPAGRKPRKKPAVAPADLRSALAGRLHGSYEVWWGLSAAEHPPHRP
jgi:hypothetical protein